MSNKKNLNIFTTDKQTLTNILDYSNTWTEQYINAIEKELVPRTLKIPLFALWEITSNCPQNCVYCYNKSPRKCEELTSYQLFKVADELIESCIFKVCISGGEPNKNPNYLNLVSYLASNGISVGTVTSGWNLDLKKVRFLARNADSIQVSLDGSKPEIHDAIRRRNGSFNDAVNTINLLNECGKPPLVATSIVKENLNDFKRIYELCCNLDVYELRSQYLANVGRATEDNCHFLNEREYEEIINFVDEINKNPGTTKLSFADPTIHIKNGYDLGYCSLIRITPEGNIGISPYLDIFFGNVKKEPVDKVLRKISSGWSNEKVRRLIETEEICLKNGTISFKSDKPLFI